MKILSIGNSFSQNAQKYLHKIALGEGIDLESENLYIGGCSLETHWENVRGNLAKYQYQRNGSPVHVDSEGTVRYGSIREALEEEPCDVITFQQASHDSGLYETYQPYLQNLSEYVRKFAPQARQMIHETWAYEIDSTHGAFGRYGNSQVEMYAKLKDAYARAAASIDAEIIPAGDVIQALRALPPFDYAHGGSSLCADGFHMNDSYGEYAVGATWLAAICGRVPTKGGFVPETCGPEKDEWLPAIWRVVAEQTGAR